MTSTGIIISRVSDIADFTKRHASLIESAGHHYVEDITHLLFKIQELEDRIREMEETPDEDTVLSGLKAANELIAHYLELNDGLWKANAKLQAEIPRWVSVDDELPEQDKLVLIFTNEGILIARTSIDHGWQFLSSDITVTHWMSLPTPPEGGEE